MKNRMTNIAFVQETAIMNAQPTEGVSLKGQYCEYVKKEADVKTHKTTKTTMYLPMPP
jgi:hypothetical protein